MKKRLIMLLLIILAAMYGVPDSCFGQGVFPAIFPSAATLPDVSFDAANSAGTASGTNLGVTWNVGSGANRGAAVTIVWYNAVSITSVTGAGATWNLVSSSSANGLSHYTATYACAAPTSGSQTVTVVWNGSVAGGGAAVASFANVNQSTPVANATAYQGYSNPTQPTRSVTSASSGIVVGVCGWWDTGTCTIGQGTATTEATTPAGLEKVTMWRVASPANPQTVSATLSTEQNYTMVGYLVQKAQ